MTNSPLARGVHHFLAVIHMFRASMVDEPSRVLITLDGELSNEYVETVDRCCHQALCSGKPVHLVLRDVSLIDEAGRRCLTSVAARGVSIRANGVYNRYVIRECVSGVPRRKGKPTPHAFDAA